MRIDTNKGYNMVAWTITFAVLVAFLAFIQSPLKRAIYPKVKATSDYMLWGSWGNQVKLEPSETTTRAKIKVDRDSRSYINERHGISEPDRKYTVYGSDDSYNETKVSAGVDEDSEALLNTNTADGLF